MVKLSTWSILPRRHRQEGSALTLAQDEQNAPFYLDIRYNWTTFKKVFVLGSLQNNKWQPGETPEGFPFDSGYLTTVKIVPCSEASAYKIYANGQHIYDFKYRSGGTPDKVKSVRVIAHEVDQPVQVTQLMVI